MRMLACLLSLFWLALAAAPAEAWQDAAGPTYRLPPIESAPLEQTWEPESLPATLADDVLAEDLAAPDFLPAQPKRREVGGGNRSPLSTYAYWVPAEPLSGQPGELSLTGAGTDLALPLSLQEGNVWLLTGGVHRLEIGSSAVLPASQIPLPDALWRVQVGTMHFRELANGWQAGGIVSVGSASDEPFAGLREMNGSVVAFLNIPSGETDAWNFSLFYSPTSQLPFPIPGVAYVWRPSDELEMKIGIPFSVEYRPTEALTFSASYLPLTNVRMQARQQWGESWSTFAGYEVTNETYFLSQRLESEDRLYFFDQRLRAGLERKLGWGFCAELSVAYLLDREIFQANSFSGDRDDAIRIDDGVMGMFNISWRR